MNYCMNFMNFDRNDKNYEVLAWHDEEYRKEVGNYQTTIAEILEFFKKRPQDEEAVKRDMRSIARGEATYEYIANDLSVPIILVKYFQKIWGY